MRKIPLILLAIPLFTALCNKPVPEVMPCDQDQGYLSRKLHLANVKFLDEERAIDWFEIYENLEERRRNSPAANCIPQSNGRTIEQMIERREHDLKNLR